MSDNSITVRFWGVRGSIPAPLTIQSLQQKLVGALRTAQRSAPPQAASDEDLLRWMEENLDFCVHSTIGGNTTCVEVRCDDALIILDMGSGIRALGMALVPEILKNKRLYGTILQSHVHWDHIQGLPFWAPLYMPRENFDTRFSFYGGKDWDKKLEGVLRMQMRPPYFPVPWGEIEQVALQMKFFSVCDGKTFLLTSARAPIKVTCRKLNHPQETFGYRIEYCGKVLAFCTDHEPYPALHRGLVDLAQQADIFVTDCQYSYDEYCGKKCVPKLGWGHAFPKYIAEVAATAQPKLVVTTHHDPESSDAHIVALAREIEELSSVRTIPAYEGLQLQC
ncbi:MAG: MBL fold metallo-hydrolase [Parcubacteria group bacterium]